VSSINRVGTTPTNATSVQFTVIFSESVTGVDTGDFTLATTGVSGASISTVSPAGPATTYTVTVNTGSGDGTIGLNLVDDDSIVMGLQILWEEPALPTVTSPGKFIASTKLPDSIDPGPDGSQ